MFLVRGWATPLTEPRTGAIGWRALFETAYALLRAARECEPLAVGRPVERENSIRFEVGQLPGRAAVERLNPDVRDTSAVENVG